MSKARIRGQLTLSVLSMVAAVASAAGQERQMGGGVGITVFTARDFRGTSATFQHDVPVLKALNLNDKIASLRIARGEQWEVCQDDHYKGRCVVVSGEERDLRRNGWANTISSMRRVGAPAPIPPATLPAPAPWPPTDWYIVLFDQPNYRGRPVNYTTTLANLSPSRPTRSVTIGKGIWQLCDGANFTGRCLTLDQSTSRLGTANTSAFRVRSIRPVRRQPR